jgi:hypothetical protein
MIELTDFAGSTPFDDRPWLMLGKGPTFGRIDEFDVSEFNLLSLNHVVAQRNVQLAHIIDVDVVDDCESALAANCQFLVMPRVPHVNGQVGLARLEEYFRASPALRKLDRENRLVWYNAETGPPVGGSPTVEVKFFGSEAALGVLGRLGASKVRSLGVDGGASYATPFAPHVDMTLLANGQPSFDSQFAELRRIARRFDIDFRPMIEPLRVFVGAGPDETVAYQVLAHSIHARSSVPVVVESLAGIQARSPKSRANRPRTAFSFNRFAIPELCGGAGRAVYVDSDMLVLGDVRELAQYDLAGAAIACTRQERPPAWEHNEWFHPGRQFSVMVIDCEAVDWTMSEVIDRLDRGDYTYQELMFELALVPDHLINDGLDPGWNSLEKVDESTKLLHYTVVPTQPWKVTNHPLGDIWLQAFCAAVHDGAVARRDVEQLVRSGGGRHDLLDHFDRSRPPHVDRKARNVAEVALQATLAELRRARDRPLKRFAKRQVPRFYGAARTLRARWPESRIVRLFERSISALRAKFR